MLHGILENPFVRMKKSNKLTGSVKVVAYGKCDVLSDYV
jgi:hypothetical protein